MRKFFSIGFVSGILLFPLPSHGLVTGNYTAAEDDPLLYGYSISWNQVYRVNASAGGGTGVPVSLYWLLTAKHVADDKTPAEVQVGSSIYTAVNVFYHPQADLALLQFSTPVFSSGHYPLYTGTFPVSPRLEGVLVGFGYNGTVSSHYYTPSTGGHNVKRWGTNMIDGTADNVVIGSTTNDVIYMNFDSGDSPYEAGLATYDSGGPVLVNDSGVWKLAGINIAIGRHRSGTPSGSFDRLYAVRIPAYADWITNTIPEPNTTVLLAVSAVVASLRRFKRSGAPRAKFTPRPEPPRFPTVYLRRQNRRCHYL